MFRVLFSYFTAVMRPFSTVTPHASCAAFSGSACTASASGAYFAVVAVFSPRYASLLFTTAALLPVSHFSLTAALSNVTVFV